MAHPQLFVVPSLVMFHDGRAVLIETMADFTAKLPAGMALEPMPTPDGDGHVIYLAVPETMH
jgi:hypothetical protein